MNFKKRGYIMNNSLEFWNYRITAVDSEMSQNNYISYKNREDFVSQYSEEERIIAHCLYSKRFMYSDVSNHYSEIKPFILSLFEYMGYDEEYYSEYFSEDLNTEVLLMTKEQIIKRLAILEVANIDVKCAFENVFLLTRYSDLMIYYAIKKLKESKAFITPSDISDYIANNDMVNCSAKANIFTTNILAKGYEKKLERILK